MDELIKLAVNSSGALAVAFLAFFYMEKRDQLFTHTINEYLKDSIKVKQELASKLQEFSDAAREQRFANVELKESNHELRTVIERMYDEMVRRSKRSDMYGKPIKST